MTDRERRDAVLNLRDWALELEQPGEPRNPSRKNQERIKLLRDVARELEQRA